MATKAELIQARKEINNSGIPFAILSDILWHYNWFTKDDPNNIKNPYTRDDYEIACIREAINIWKNNNYNTDNIKKMIGANGRPDDVGGTLERVKVFKNTGTGMSGDWYRTWDRGMIFLKWWVEDLNNLNDEKTTLTTYQTKYNTLAQYWLDNLKADFNHMGLYPDGLKEIKPVLEKLRTDKTQLEQDKQQLITDKEKLQTDLNTANQEKQNLNSKITQLETDKEQLQTEKNNLLGEWKADFEEDFGDVLDEASLKAVKNKLDTLQTDNGELFEKIQELETAKINLNNQITLKDKTIEDKDHEIKELKQQIAKATESESEQLTLIRKQLADKEKELATRTQEKATAEHQAELWHNNYNMLDKHYQAQGKKNEELETKLKEKDGEIGKLKEQGNQSNQYLNKLLELYKTQITKETQAFYLVDLKLDESKNINPKYWGGEDNEKSYLEKLNELKGESEPQQVINAFKIVALIAATEKCQAISDEWINKNVAKNKQFRLNKFNQFASIEKFWYLLTEKEPVEIKEENNPLYLPIIKDKETYKKQLDTILQLWN